MKSVRISVARDFSMVPAGREVVDGPFSGERFRQQHLFPALKTGNQVIVDLDGTLGYGSSFLEEAFGGLVRADGFGREFLQRLQLEASDRTLKTEIEGYINDALAVAGKAGR